MNDHHHHPQPPHADHEVDDGVSGVEGLIDGVDLPAQASVGGAPQDVHQLAVAVGHGEEEAAVGYDDHRHHAPPHDEHHEEGPPAKLIKLEEDQDVSGAAADHGVADHGVVDPAAAAVLTDDNEHHQQQQHAAAVAGDVPLPPLQHPMEMATAEVVLAEQEQRPAFTIRTEADIMAQQQGAGVPALPPHATTTAGGVPIKATKTRVEFTGEVNTFVILSFIGNNELSLTMSMPYLHTQPSKS